MKQFILIAASLLFLLNAPTFCQGNISKAKDLFNQKKYSESKTILQKIIDDNEKEAEAHYLLSKIYYIENNIDDAVESAETAVDLKQTNAEYHYWLGACYGKDAQSASIFRKPFLASKTKNEFLKATELDPGHINAHSALGQYYLRAPGIMGGSMDKAIEQADILLKLDEIQGRLLYISIYADQKKMDKVSDEYKSLEKLIGSNKAYFSFYNLYGYFLLNQGKINEAIEKFKKQVEIAPGNANAHDSYGEALLKKGLLKESLEQYKLALQIDPNLTNAKNKVAEINQLIAKKGGS